MYQNNSFSLQSMNIDITQRRNICHQSWL